MLAQWFVSSLVDPLCSLAFRCGFDAQRWPFRDSFEKGKDVDMKRQQGSTYWTELMNSSNTEGQMGSDRLPRDQAIVEMKNESLSVPA